MSIPSIRLVHLSFAYNPNIPLFDGNNVHLSAGWTGVVGANGCGKSTLLALIAGELAPTGGQIQLHPNGAPVHRCPQRVEHQTPEIQAFAWGWDRLAMRLRGQLKLDPEELERWSTLSPGERKRWQVGAALWHEPAILLLDEPTNHLDSEARNLLLLALKAFQGIGLVVSHDRVLLETLTTSTLKLSGYGKATLYKGHYSDALRQWEADAEVRQGKYADAKRQQRKLSRRLNDARRSRSAAERNMSSRRRMKGPKDTDARSSAAKSRAINGEVTLSRQVEVIRKQHERASDAVNGYTFEASHGRSLFIDYQPSPRSRLMTLDQDEVCAGEHRLLRDVHLVVERQSRIWLRGPNGSGKSTLLRALLNQASIPEERLLVLPQALSTHDAAQLMAHVRALPSEQSGRVMQCVAALGVDPSKLLESKHPSPGELRKLMIAFGLGRQVWGLFLDEPTNHMDLPSIERLEAALADYPGALILISHDPHFARVCTQVSWRLGETDQRIAFEQSAEI